MKRVFYKLSVLVFSSFFIQEGVVGIPNPFTAIKDKITGKNKDTAEENLKKMSSAFKDLSKTTGSISTGLDTAVEKNFSKVDDVVLLPALRILTKNLSESFKLIYIAIESLKTNLANLKKAKEKLENAKEKDKEKAQNEVERLIKEINREVMVIVGDTLNGLIANTKAAATIFLQLLQEHQTFTGAEVGGPKKDAKKSKELSNIADGLIGDLQKIIETIEADILEIDIDDAHVAAAMADTTLITNITGLLNDYFNDEKLSSSTIEKYLQSCSLDKSVKRPERVSKNEKAKKKQNKRKRKDDPDTKKNLRMKMMRKTIRKKIIETHE